MKTKHPVGRLALLSVIVFFVAATSCKNAVSEQKSTALNPVPRSIVVAANRTDKYLSLLKDKNVAVAVNNTSVIFKNDGSNSSSHLVDSLLAHKVSIKTMFAPEHGVRGKIDAGEKIVDGIDEVTGLPVISLYGKNYKPGAEQLKDIDVVLFDIQDVGVRFYTYLSTLHYIMEACAENNIQVIVLDRPNPNGHYIDGPIAEEAFKSFVGLHPVPIVYGMTIGEYAQMINGERWLKDGIQCDLTVIPLENYTHQSTYSLPLRPSPNLPNDTAINLYPSICLFEGTNVSCGRGTEMQFQIFGSPYLPAEKYPFTFVPQPNFGSGSPKHQDQKCYGLDLSASERLNELNFQWVIDAYHNTGSQEEFFKPDFFNKLAGTDALKKQIEAGLSFEEIKKTWQPGLEAFKQVRKKYLIYED